jgi:hypothetical protein
VLQILSQQIQSIRGVLLLLRYLGILTPEEHWRVVTLFYIVSQVLVTIVSGQIKVCHSLVRLRLRHKISAKILWDLASAYSWMLQVQIGVSSLVHYTCTSKTANK